MSVYGTDALVYTGAFLGWHFGESASAEASTSPCGTATISRRPPSMPASFRFKCRRRGNICPLSIVYAHRPRLRIRLTLGGRTFPRKPWVYGDRGLHPVYRYSCLHPHFPSLHRPLPDGFNAAGTLSYRSLRTPELRYNAYRQSFSARKHSMSQLLRTV